MATTDRNHLCPTRRRTLPPAIRTVVGAPDRSRWESHPGYGGTAGFWISIHDRLRAGTQQIVDLAAAARADPERAPSQLAEARRIAEAVGTLTHRHHTFEDQLYFPQMVRAQPRLADALELLEGDHRVLGRSLAELDAALRHGDTGSSARDLERIERGAEVLRRALHQHLFDEEDVVIPIFLANRT